MMSYKQVEKQLKVVEKNLILKAGVLLTVIS